MTQELWIARVTIDTRPHGNAPVSQVSARVTARMDAPTNKLTQCGPVDNGFRRLAGCFTSETAAHNAVAAYLCGPEPDSGFYRFEPKDAKRLNGDCYLYRGDEISGDVLIQRRANPWPIPAGSKAWRKVYVASIGDTDREFPSMREARAFLLGYCEHMDSIERGKATALA